jgi:hypothetical protein
MSQKVIEIILSKGEKVLEYLKVSVSVLRFGKPFPFVRKRQGHVLRNSDIKFASVRIRESGDRFSELGRLYFLSLKVQKMPLGVGEHFQKLFLGKFVNRYWHSSSFDTVVVS